MATLSLLLVNAVFMCVSLGSVVVLRC